MVLIYGQDNFIAGRYVRSKTSRHQIDGFRATFGEYNRFGRWCIDEVLDFRARPLIGFGGLIRQCMKTAMHIRVCCPGLLAHLVQNAVGFLRTCGVVQIGQRAAIHFAPKDWKLRTDRFDI